MNYLRPLSIFIFLSLFVSLISSNFAGATSDPGNDLQKAGIIERLSEKIDLSLEFEMEDGSMITLNEIFKDGKPVIIAPVYFECPRLCTLTQNGLLETIVSSELILDKDYKVLSISFNDKETSQQSSKRAKVYRDKFPEPLKKFSKGWSFLTGQKSSTAKLMKELGYGYEYDQGEYMHAAGIIILTPEGQISRYLYGIEYPARDFKLALVEAGQGKIGSFMNQALMFCFRYDHIKGQYSLAIWQIIRIVCSVIAIIILLCVFGLKIKEKK